jgi:predicted TIM-barrel fold metal-dependent hydrolase
MKHQSEHEGIGRRKFLSQSGITLLGASMPGIIKAPLTDLKNDNNQQTTSSFKRDGWKTMLQESLKYRKLDAHNHVGGARGAAQIVESCDRVGITRAACSRTGGKSGPDVIRQNNDAVLAAMKEFPNRIMGQCWINPVYKKEALDEIQRCVDNGMVMLGELYDSYKVNDPLYYPVIEKCINLKIPLMWHGVTTLGNWRNGYLPTNPPNSSLPEDFADAGRRYPEAMIICGHIGGGGNWEYVCRVLKDAPTIYVDTSGSVSDEGMIDMAVKYIGADRLLFATDVNYETAVGKIMWADLTDSQRKKIFFENFNNLLRKAGNHVS